MPADLTPEESEAVARMLGELHGYGYQDVAEHGRLQPGARIRHRGHRWYEALERGTGVVVAITEKPDSVWSRSWGAPDIELIALWDEPRFTGGRLSQLAQYHVAAIEA